ncbi:NADPH-dependent ferric siderophore reductase [Kytococcus schroeteri]|uniref:NADPH-dependent ferric siderophore reductase n=1 Tax=Kytococcus schroeteri TaxID=138300 RepID=A0A2I1P911_9MICO|nr:siderophore-interacting protein [Kytococcus schroeteri]PKZ41125.1 NADPH-dependent ferric siderophore reductase [Kytococcus schroeteri]
MSQPPQQSVPGSGPGGRPPRPVRSARVDAVEWLTPEMVRVWLTGEGVGALPELEHTDHYVKLLFPPAGAPYGHPVDREKVQAEQPREWWPVTRTYTVRTVRNGRMALDFVSHGDEGLAGPWAASAQPGDRITFLGPGGAWSPTPEAHHLLAGDESAIPAVAAAMERIIATGGTAQVFVEVSTAEAVPELPEGEGIELHRVLRDGTAHGHALAHAVRERGRLPEGVQVFVHGVAEMVKEMRRHLFVEHGLSKADVSISGYWRTGCTEDEWQAGKRDFMAQLEAEEGRLEQG